MKLYALSLCAQFGRPSGQVNTVATYYIARNKYEAIGLGLEHCFNVFDRDKGWIGHQVVQIEIPVQDFALSLKSQELYAISLYADRKHCTHVETKTTAAYSIAVNEDEAKRWAIEKSKSVYGSHEGWEHHEVLSCVKIPQDVIAEALK